MDAVKYMKEVQKLLSIVGELEQIARKEEPKIAAVAMMGLMAVQASQEIMKMEVDEWHANSKEMHKKIAKLERERMEAEYDVLRFSLN